MTGLTISSGPHPGPDRTDWEVVEVSQVKRAPGMTFRATVRVPTEDQPAALVALEVVSSDGTGITVPDLRRAPFGLVHRLVLGHYDNAVISMAAAHLGIEGGPRPYGGGDLKHHRAVAAIYRNALTQGISPRQAVADIFEVSVQTVDRWLRDARDAHDPVTNTSVLGPYQDEQKAHGLSSRERAFLKSSDPSTRQTSDRRATP